jgi:hypothetical protein
MGLLWIEIGSLSMEFDGGVDILYGEFRTG